MKAWATLLLLCSTLALAAPGEAEIESRTQRLAHELRCLVCQNQTLAESSAPLALDLKQQVRELVAAGKTDDEVLAHLTDRYGDFVRYRPPVKATTWVLWAGPGLLFLLAIVLLVRVVRKRAQLPDSAFDAAFDKEPRDVA
jgi:cytochrome c-type biogenesis protein CcmH